MQIGGDMVTLLNKCPECKSANIGKHKINKHGSSASIMTVLGILFLLIGFAVPVLLVIGVALLVIAIPINYIREETYECKDCKTEWK